MLSGLSLRVLLLHARDFEYRAVKKAIKKADEFNGVKREGKFSNYVIAFTTVESGDNESVIEQAVEDLLDYLSKVKADGILIYPYAHLSSDLAPPELAVKILDQLVEELRKRGVVAQRAPFGWYKEFKINVYGHPLAELSRTFKPKEKKFEIEKKFLIITPQGEILPPERYKEVGDPDLARLVEKEVFGKTLEGGEPKVIRYCKKFGFEPEPYSDPGHMRYSPLAEFMIDAVMEYSWKVVKEFGERANVPVFKVRGTNMFRLSVEPIRKHAELFGDRLYELRSDKDRLILRFAACHQQFAMVKDWVISYKNLPFGTFELADAYRLEQSGEVVTCFRLRRFYMPDLHIYLKSLDEAMRVGRELHKFIHEKIRELGRQYVNIYNVAEDFFEKEKDFIKELVKMDGKPALITLVPSGIYYWVLNIEFNIIDELGRPREIGTWQIDVGNAERFGIKYKDENGEDKYPVIIHTAIIGSVERYVYAVLDTAARMESEKKTPYIPTWLSPIQVRLIPVSREYLDYAIELARRLEELGVRVDVDDRDEGMGKKIRDAGKEWIPYIVVIGKRERETGQLSVRIRRTNDIRQMNVEELASLVKEECKGKPLKERTLPLLVSQRPMFTSL